MAAHRSIIPINLQTTFRWSFLLTLAWSGGLRAQPLNQRRLAPGHWECARSQHVLQLGERLRFNVSLRGDAKALRTIEHQLDITLDLPGFGGGE